VVFVLLLFFVTHFDIRSFLPVLKLAFNTSIPASQSLPSLTTSNASFTPNQQQASLTKHHNGNGWFLFYHHTATTPKVLRPFTPAALPAEA
jgi:hypothetical protein